MEVYVCSLVDTIPIRRSRFSHDHTRREITRKYHLRVEGISKPVYKKSFLATTVLGEWSVQEWTKPRPNGAEKEHCRPLSAYYN